jgi:hypothetical protein
LGSQWGGGGSGAKSVENLSGLFYTVVQGEAQTNSEDWIEVTEYGKESLRVTSEEDGAEGRKVVRAGVVMRALRLATTTRSSCPRTGSR